MTEVRQGLSTVRNSSRFVERFLFSVVEEARSGGIES